MKTVMNIVTTVFILAMVLVYGLPLLGYKPYHILSGSMEPTYSVGEIVLVNTKDADWEVGDIAAFQAGNTTVIHRVESVTDGIVTKGDANAMADPGVRAEDELIGKAVIGLGFLSPAWVFLHGNGKNAAVIILVAINLLADSLEKKAGRKADEADKTRKEVKAA